MLKAVQQPQKSAKGQRISDNRRADREQRAARDAKRRRHEQEVAVRMTHRFFAGQMPPLITLDYRYWQARKCGWDALSEAYARNMEGRACDPNYGAAWNWWRARHWKERQNIMRLSTFQLKRA